MIACKRFRRATVWLQARVLPPDASARKRLDVHHVAASELLADNEIRERYCSV
jgi:hypothetical protein